MLVVAAIIKKNGKYLLTQRPLGTYAELRWEFPGGKVKFGEDPRECLEREIEEELGVRIKAGEVFECSSHVYGEKHVVLLGFLCTIVSGKVKRKEVNDFRWLTPDEMNDYDIVEADIPFVKKLQKKEG
jgi:8-oxo-dGTP diphosphatase